MRRTIAVIAFAAAPVLAVNLTDDAPLAHFKGKDRETFDAVLYAVLDDGKPGTTRAWSNPETRAGGQVKALKSFMRGESACRTVHVSNRAEGRTSAANYNFCKSAEGKWVLAQ
jgi:surface antigen